MMPILLPALTVVEKFILTKSHVCRNIRIYEGKNTINKERRIKHMGKRIYVNGGILITTPFFAYKNAGASYDLPPENSEIIEPNTITETGEPYLEISNEHPQSIFNEYYAKTFFTTQHTFAYFFAKDFIGSYNDFKQRIDEIQSVINIKGLDEQKQNIINKLSYINIITSLDTFICDIILTKIIQDEESFNNFFNSIPPCKKKDEMTKLKEDNLVAQWEQKAIEYVMRTSYSNIDTIKDILKELFKVSIIDTNGKMKKHFYYRNLLAHRNGRKKDGGYINITNEELKSLITDTQSIAKQIQTKIKPEH
nr:MAG TPA: PSP RiboL-PSP-HEPN [Caudoviricetes sp.]